MANIFSKYPEDFIMPNVAADISKKINLSSECLLILLILESKLLTADVLTLETLGLGRANDSKNV